MNARTTFIHWVQREKDSLWPYKAHTLVEEKGICNTTWLSIIKEFIGDHGSTEEETLNQTSNNFLKCLFHCDSFAHMHINDWKFACTYVVMYYVALHLLSCHWVWK